MKWLDSIRSRTSKNSHGRKKIKKIDANLRRELTRICNRLTAISEQVSDRDALTLFEVALCNLFSDISATSRDGIFIAVENILNSRQKGKQRVLATKEAVESYETNSDIIGTGIISRSMVDNLMKMLSERHVDQHDKSQIYKSIILRLAGELDPEHIKDIMSFDLPGIEEKKVTRRDGHMYG